MLIKFQAELGETDKESEQQIGSAYLPGHRASIPEQLLPLSHNTNRLGGADTACRGWQRSVYMFTILDDINFSQKLDLHFGETRVPCVCEVCVMY